MSFFGSSSPATDASPSSTDVKSAVVRQVREEAAMNNARSLISKINEHCFDACIPAPGSTLSSKENTCLSSCMEKYIAMWNVTSRTYLNRINQENKRMGSQDAAAIGSMASGSSEGGSGLLG